MGRHYRDEEPVPHPPDRTPAEGRPAARPGEESGSYPVEGRSEASGAFRKPKRSSISDAFGIAGRVTGASRVPGRGERSGSYPVAGRGEASGSYPAVGRDEPSDTYSARGRGAYPVAGRGEASGAYPAVGRDEPAVSYPAAGRDEPPARRGEASGAYPAVGRDEPAAAYPATRRGEASGNYPITERRAPAAPRRGEASGAHPVAAPGPERDEPTAVHPVADGTKSRVARRGDARAARAAESAAERTEVITRADEPGRGEASGSFRTLTREQATGTSRTSRRTETGGKSAENTAPPRRGERRAAAKTEALKTEPAKAAAGKTETTRTETGKSEATGSHRTLGKGDVTGSHRIVGKKAPRRRIAGWPIACLVLAALIGLGIVGWNWADSELNSRAEAQAASCSQGTSHMRIVVTPSVQKPLAAAAERWNQAATVVHGQCVHVMIEAKASSQVLDALVGRANLDSIGGLPAAWLPESSYWVSELTTKKPEMIGSPAQSVATARSADYPFVGLSGQGVDDILLRAAQTFREYLEQPAQQADFAAAGIKAA